MQPLTPGPSYREMFDPRTLPTVLRDRSIFARADELNPGNLFNITWRGADGEIRYEALPRELTGVEANILVMLGRGFPSGSHKVGAAYSTLMEGELAGEIVPGVHTVIGPSTGNFGIGTAYVAKLKGYEAVVIMPKGMSAERYQRIKQYGGRLDLTAGSESDVVFVLERTEEYKKDERNKVLAQFELFPNYRFHRVVTGRSALEAARKHGNGRVAAFVSAPGSAGTIAAGDEIKAQFPDAVVCALEPKECPTMFNHGAGEHRIEGIGDAMVTLIHNLLTTDYVALIHDDDCVMGLELLERRQALLARTLHLPEASLGRLRGNFGVSGLCNVLGAIRLARHLGLGPDDNVVTVATDSFDRYPSVLANLAERNGLTTDQEAGAWFEPIFRGGSSADILDVRPPDQKDRLFGYKEELWTKFHYTREYLDRMKSQAFWDDEYDKAPGVDEALLKSRAGLSKAVSR